jgi:type VI protein secretion system component Hcp
MDRTGTKNRNDAEVRNLNDATQNRELAEAELVAVSGGVSDIMITKVSDSASTSLFKETLVGKAQRVPIN